MKILSTDDEGKFMTKSKNIVRKGHSNLEVNHPIIRLNGIVSNISASKTSKTENSHALDITIYLFKSCNNADDV
jgi:hypothetical protein